LFSDQTVESIIEAIKKFEIETKPMDYTQIRLHAEQFSRKIFEEKIKNYVDNKSEIFFKKKLKNKNDRK